MITNRFFISQAHPQRNFRFLLQDDARNIKSGNWERRMVKNSKLQYLFQK